MNMNTCCRSLVFAALLAISAPFAALAQPTLLASGLQGTSGSAVGPDGALYVTEGATGQLSRIDPETGEVTVVASGLPPSAIGIGGAIDVTFIGETPYVLVTLVAADLDMIFGPGTAPNGGEIVGIYRIDGPNSYTIIADIGAHSLANPPTIAFDYFIPTGVQYAVETYRGGLLVTDGHLNRVLWITLDGEISVFQAFGNVVPTGLDVHGSTVYMAETGAVPHLPEDGRVVSFGPRSSEVTEVASGGPLMVDVKFGRGRTLYALAQGTWDGAFPGSPAIPGTGAIYRVQGDGSVAALAENLMLPTSFQVIDNTAYIVTLVGEVWKLENLSAPPFGARKR
jgi:sugar lactone lactonase YvrE